MTFPIDRRLAPVFALGMIGVLGIQMAMNMKCIGCGGLRRVALGLVLVVAALPGIVPVGILRAEPPPPWIDELNRLSRFIGQTVSPADLGTVDGAVARQPEVRALRAALLYRADPSAYGSELHACFEVHDYAERSRGKKTDISQEAFLSRIREVEAAYPSLSPQLVMLVSFVRTRDANLWFPQGDKTISVARFLRGAFLAQVFKGSDLDAVAVADSLDQAARKGATR